MTKAAHRGPEGGSVDISRKTDYALRMLAALVRRPEEVLSVRKAAEENHIPYSFARSIQHELANAGLIESLCGSRGGMRLAVDPYSTSLLQIVEAIQGPLRMVNCGSTRLNSGACPLLGGCSFHHVWRGAQELLADYLDSVTLAEIVMCTKAPEVSARFSEPGAFEKLFRRWQCDRRQPAEMTCRW